MTSPIHVNQNKWKTNIVNVELKMLLRAIHANPESFEIEINKRRNHIMNINEYIHPISPTVCVNSPTGVNKLSLSSVVVARRALLKTVSPTHVHPDKFGFRFKDIEVSG